MVRAGAAFGPDAQRRWADGPIALGHCGLWTVEESIGETQPRSAVGVDGARARWIVCDGRVDNRGELIRDLRARSTDQQPTDTELILEAYIAWGVGCASR